MNFRKWLSESSLRDELNWPQNPKHHPEGNVRRHTMMVRHSLDKALKMLREKKIADPKGPLANLDFELNPTEYNILRLAGLLHDIGKGESFERKTLPDGSEKISHIGHEQPEFFEPAMRRLGPSWQEIYADSNPTDKADLWYLIKNHMSLDDDVGIESKSLKRDMLDDQGRYKPDRRVKLLLILFIMDRLGRGGTPTDWRTAKNFAQNNTDAGDMGVSGIYATSNSHKQNLERMAKRASKPSPDNPEEFVASMREKGKSDEIIKAALKNKFKDIPEDEISRLI